MILINAKYIALEMREGESLRILLIGLGVLSVPIRHQLNGNKASAQDAGLPDAANFLTEINN